LLRLVGKKGTTRSREQKPPAVSAGGFSLSVGRTLLSAAVAFAVALPANFPASRPQEESSIY